MWKPWIGSKYENRKLLLLGESCYDWEEKDGSISTPQPNHPEVLVREMMDGFPLPNHRFMNALTRAICGSYAPSLAEVADAWETAAFTNYVPVSVGVGPGVRPSSQAWMQARNEWPQVLAMLQPLNAIVVGLTMWGDIRQDKHGGKVQGYRLADGTVVMCRATWHTRAGGSWKAIAGEIRAAEQPNEPAPENSPEQPPAA